MHSFCPEHKGGKNEISIEKQKYKFILLQNGDKSEFFLLTFSAKEKVRRYITMSGHSKWKNIMHKKEKTDSQRAKIFTKIGKEIAMAVRDGGADPNTNGKLHDLIAKARQTTCPTITSTEPSRRQAVLTAA